MMNSKNFPPELVRFYSFSFIVAEFTSCSYFCMRKMFFTIDFVFALSCWMSSDNKMIWIFVAFVVVIETVRKSNVKSLFI